MTALLDRQVLVSLLSHRVTVYLADGNHTTGILSGLIEQRDKHAGTPRAGVIGLHLVDLDDGTPHDAVFVYLDHVTAIARTRETRSATGDEPTRTRAIPPARHVELDDGTGSARFVLDHDVRITLDRSGTRTRAVVIEWTANGERCSIDASAASGPLELRADFAGHTAEELSS